jgi:hypothetical protein
MRSHREDHSIGRPTIAGLGVVVAAFMVLSLVATATGTARFAVSMGYAPPRPVKTVAEALSATRVPNGVWKDSHECAAIQESAYFARACAQVVQLHRELAAAGDYERLSMRAGELRNGLAAAPIVATSDPLPAAFSATLGRVLHIGGTEGVALLLTMVVEIISCCGFGWLQRAPQLRRPNPSLGDVC